MSSVVVIRRKPKNRFPRALVNQTADVLGWSPDAAEKALTGAGWTWAPGAWDSVRAAAVSRKLGEIGMQAGTVSPVDAADLGEFRSYARTAVDGDALKLRGEAGELALSKAAPGGAVLLGLRWDGKAVRRFDHGARKPGLLVWGRTGPLGVLWLREGRDEAGLTALELGSLVEQLIARQGLVVLDDSYIADDLPTPNARFRAAWAAAGGAAGDERALLHAVMIRALQQQGVLQTRAQKPFDPDAPLTTYAIVKRRRVWFRVDQTFAWAAAAAAVLSLRFAPDEAFTTVAGAVAGLAAVVHSVRIFGHWMRLTTRPRSKVRSMAMGPVRLAGEVEEAMRLVSPLRGVRCVYYRNKHERRGEKGGWRTLSDVESPVVPFYLKDETGKVLVDTLDAEWNGLETYVHRVSHNERIREWVMPSSLYAEIYGFAHADPEAPVVAQVREGLSVLFLEAATHFDVNHDGVISDAERAVALRALDEQLRADTTNVSLQGGVYVGEMRREPLVISSKRALPLGVVRSLAVAGWLAAALALFLSVFVFRDEAAALLRVLISERWFS